MDNFIETLFSDPQMLRMGHAQRVEDRNLGLGWVYYALGRLLRPRRVVVIGSYRGFVPAVLAKSLVDNSETGEVIFIDPSYADDFWADPDTVRQHFAGLGTPNVRHYRHTTQEFLTTGDYEELTDIGILMIDGYHSAEQARLDYLAFLGKLAAQHIVLFHDSVAQRTSTFYGEDNQYQHTVCLFMDRLRRTPGLEVFTLPFGGGVTLVRGQPESLEYINAPFDNKPLTPAAVSMRE